MRKLLIAPVVGLVFAAAPANAQNLGSILNSVMGGGSNYYGYQPTYGYQQTYQPAYSYQQSYGYQPAYGYQQSYGYQPAYGYQQTYSYRPRYVYSQPRYAPYGYRAPVSYRYARYRHVAYRRHAHRHHHRSYAYVGSRYREYRRG